MEKKKYFLDIAHMHPICPLSLSHARIFILADVWARWKRKQGFSVRFPICMHYSGSTVFNITNAISNFLQKQKLSDADQKILDLILNFYKIPGGHLHKLTEPLNVLNYFSETILRDLKSIQISYDREDYFNTNNQLYQDFVRSVFDVYAKKLFIKTSNDHKALDYPNPLFRDSAVKRLNETKFSPPTAKAMVAESLEKLDNEWSFERGNSIGTNMGGYVIDPMFDAEFLSVFNAMYPYLKDLGADRSKARDIFREFFYKTENPDKKNSALVEELYSNSQEILPVNKFIVERHLQNWVAKKIYAETILSPVAPSTSEYFFLGSVTKNGQVDSASRGLGITLSQLIETVGPESARTALLLTIGTPHRDYELGSTLEHARKKLNKFKDFFGHFKNSSIQKQRQVEDIIKNKKVEIDAYINCGKIRRAVLVLFDELPKIIQPFLVDSLEENSSKDVSNFLYEYLNIFCPSLVPKLYEK